MTMFVLGMTGPTLAGDMAAFNPLGFSADGNIFAFEQYGIQDGSGFPYSEIFVIDTAKDAFLPKTPIRVRIDDEMAGLSEARAKAGGNAAPVLTQHGIADHPGHLVAFNPVSEIEAPAHQLGYRAFPAEPAFGEPYRLSLTETEAQPSDACKDLGTPIKGFRLSLTEKNGEAADITLHEDGKAVPSSRRCPTGYRIGGVMTFHPMQGEPLHVALVLVLSYGFEGRDGRWIAVPFRP
ncbi:DUF2259 domain-containing protein [Ciceribacter sp. L1K23]|uniref:DUF2259 domain-containing protein n=1 Tax=Ciceribacter sp. L1K23 TaxID=2820276 RepID=UPI001B83740E|nr:DUF2259 domain-containing protein [Ciceribacter sp. L1K23]MBR0555327.1 DUF2259 domain-containing protein [Ciceribacter sp. L1K23]